MATRTTTILDAKINIELVDVRKSLSDIKSVLSDFSGNKGLVDQVNSAFDQLNKTVESTPNKLQSTREALKDLKTEAAGIQKAFGGISKVLDIIIQPSSTDKAKLSKSIEDAVQKAVQKIEITFDTKRAVQNLQTALRSQKVVIDLTFDSDRLRSQLKSDLGAAARSVDVGPSPFVQSGTLAQGGARGQVSAARVTAIRALRAALDGAELSADNLEITLEKTVKRLQELGGTRVDIQNLLNVLTKAARLQAARELDIGGVGSPGRAEIEKSAELFLNTFTEIGTEQQRFTLRSIAEFEKLATEGIQSFNKLNTEAQREMTTLFQKLVFGSIIPDGNAAILKNFKTVFSKVLQVVSDTTTRIANLFKTRFAAAVDSLIQKFNDLNKIAPLGEIVQNTADKALSVFDQFKRDLSREDPFSPVVTQAEDMSDELVGNSIIPDMLDKIESEFRRLPDKTIPEVIALRRELSGIQKEVKNINFATLSPQELAIVNEEVVKVGNSLERVQAQEISRVTGEIRKISEVAADSSAGLAKNQTILQRIGVTAGDVGGQFVKVQDGVRLALTGEGVLNRLVGVREVIEAIGGDTNFLAQGLNKVEEAFLGTGQASTAFAQAASRIAERTVASNDALEAQVVRLKQVAKLQGVNTSSLNQLQSQARTTNAAVNNLFTDIESGGTISPNSLQRVVSAVQELDRNFGFLEATLPELGEEAQEAFKLLREQVSGNDKELRSLFARLETINKEASDTRQTFGFFGNALRKVGGLFGFFKDAENDVRKANIAIRGLNSSLQITTRSAGAIKGAFLGAFAGVGFGTLLFRLQDAVEDAIITIPKKLVSLASRSEESLSKFRVVFDGAADVVGGTADQVTDQLGKLADKIGRSVLELQEAAAGFQDTFVPLGFAREDAAELSTVLVSLVSDVASFNNAQDSEVAASFQSALVGNTEAVRKYGIVITQAALDTELLRLGVEGGVQAATEQEKVMARLNLILKGTEDAQGDAARTSQSFANQLRRLTGQLTDLGVALGKKLLPALAPLLSTLNNLITNIGPTLIERFGEIAASVEDFASNFSSTIDDILRGIVDLDSNMSTAVASITSLFSGDLESAFSFLFLTIDDLLIDIADGFVEFVGRAFNFGFDFIAQVAQGMIDASISLLLEAANFAGNIIAGFFEPGSPPEEGPLSTIDRWGEGLMNTFLEGFTDADFAILDNVLSPVQDIFSEMFEGETDLAISAVRGFRDDFVQVLSGINETGVVNTQFLDETLAQLGEGNEALKDYIRSQAQLAEAQTAVSEAAKNGFVPKALQEQLRLAELNTAFKKQDLELTRQQEQAAARATGTTTSGSSDVLNDERATNEERIKGELDFLQKKLDAGLITEEEFLSAKISLEKRLADELLKQGRDSDVARQVATINADKEKLARLQELRKSALDAEREAAKESAKKTAEEIFREEAKLIERKFQLGLITEKERVRLLLALEERLFDQRNLLDQESASERIKNARDLLKSLEASLDEEFATELAAIEERLALGLISEEEKQKAILRLEERFLDDRVGIDKIAAAERIKILRKEISDRETAIRESKINLDDLDIPELGLEDSVNQEVLEAGKQTGLNFTEELKASLEEGVAQAKANLKESLSTLGTDIGQAIKDAFSDLTGVFDPVTDKLKSFFSSAESGASDLFTTLKGIFVGLIIGSVSLVAATLGFSDVGKIFAVVSTAARKVGKVVLVLAEAVFPKLTSVLRFFGKFGKTLIISILPKLGKQLTKVFGFFLKPALFAGAPIGLIISSLISGIIGNISLLGEIFDDVVARGRIFFGRIKTIFTRIFELISGSGDSNLENSFIGRQFAGLRRILSIFFELLDKLDGLVRNVFRGVFIFLQGVFQSFFVGTDIITGVVLLLLGDFDAAKEAFESALSGFKDTLLNLASGLLITIGEILAAPTDVPAAILDTILRFLGLEKTAAVVKAKFESFGNKIRDNINAIIAFLSGESGTGEPFNILSALGITDETAEKIEEIFDVIFGALDIEPLKDAFGDLGVAFEALLNLDFEVLVTALDDALVSILTSFDRLQQFLKEAFGPVFDELLKAFGKLFEVLKETGILDVLLTVLKAIGVILATVVLAALTAVVGFINGFLQSVTTFVNAISDIIEGFADFVAGVIDVIEGFFDLITAIFEGDGEGIKAAGAQILQGLKDIVQADIDIIVGIFDASIGTIIAFFEGFSESVVEIVQGLFDVLVGNSIIPDLADAMINIFEDLSNSVVRIVEEFVDSLLFIFDKIIPGAREAILAMPQVFNDAMVEAINVVTGFAEQFFNAGVQLVNSLISGLSGLKDSVGDVLSDIVPNVSANFSTPNIGSFLTGFSVPGLATGALEVGQDTLAMIHRGESVLPANVATIFRSLLSAVNSSGLGSLGRLSANRPTAQSPGSSQSNNNRQFLFGPGALAFPNVRDGRDAAGFLEELDRRAALGELRGNVV